jgi:hypothetical protein
MRKRCMKNPDTDAARLGSFTTRMAAGV